MIIVKYAVAAHICPHIWEGARHFIWYWKLWLPSLWLLCKGRTEPWHTSFAPSSFQPDNLLSPWAAYNTWILILFSLNSFYHIVLVYIMVLGLMPTLPSHWHPLISLQVILIVYKISPCSHLFQEIVLVFWFFWHITLGENDCILTSGVGRKRGNKWSVFFFSF